jgi:hypothetical protein
LLLLLLLLVFCSLDGLAVGASRRMLRPRKGDYICEHFNAGLYASSFTTKKQ